MEYEIIEVEPEPRSTKQLATVNSADGLYRGALYDPAVNASAVQPSVRQRKFKQEYWDKNGLPAFFPGARKLRKAIKLERRQQKLGGTKKQRKAKKREEKANKAKSTKAEKCPKGTERHSETYSFRDTTLGYLGFSSYEEYRASDLWKNTKIAGFKYKGNTCCLCPSNANVLHHHSYELDVLNGTNLEPLFPMCNKCHQSLEFLNGKKRPLSAVQASFRIKLYKALKQQ